jgi:hypothetical protein
MLSDLFASALRLGDFRRLLWVLNFRLSPAGGARPAVVVLVLAALSVGPAAADTQTFTASKDTTVWNEVPNINIGANSTSEVGRETAKNVPVGIKRGLLHFDTSTLPSQAIVTGATLRLFIQGVAEPVQDPHDLSVTVWRLSADFVEGDGSSGVTWNTQPGVEASPTSTADMDAEAGDRWSTM